MPTNPNMVAIQTVTVGAGGASSIEFTSIPQTYTDLKVVFSVRDATNNNGVVKITFNGSATGYTARQLYGTGSVAASNTDYTGSGTYYGTEGSSAPSNATASTFSNCELYIPNYTSSNNKSISADSLYENNGTLAYQSLSAGLWSNSAAITSIKIAQFSGNNFAQYSTATLYGVTSAGYGAKATGGIITQDANYYYHTFLASGTFTPTSNITADYLVVAGGGGGGYFGGGGGGGGGLRCTVGATGGGGSLESPLSLTASTNYTVTVGAGGSGATGSGGTTSGAGTNGSNSVFSTITSTGGGYGGSYGSSYQNGVTGGSGGGAGTFSSSGTAGAGTTNQGYAGGVGSTDNATYRTGGGGGGAGETGNTDGAASSSQGGFGGDGVATSISGTSVTYAGGGGGGADDNAQTANGGTAGDGGGGTGGNIKPSPTFPTAGTANTGGGGGGAARNSSGGAGGSGIVIVRYAK